jgi:hypothetical protein
MTHLAELASKLTPAQLRDVEIYAESLATPPADSSPKGANGNRPNRIDLDGLDGLLTRLGDDMEWPEIKKWLRNYYADSADGLT